MASNIFRSPIARTADDPHRPVIDVYLHSQTIAHPVSCIVDSGAWITVFHADEARAVGIDWEKASECSFSLEGARRSAEWCEFFFRYAIIASTADVCFTESLAVGYGLLGREGFFSKMNAIVFAQKSGREGGPRLELHLGDSSEANLEIR